MTDVQKQITLLTNQNEGMETSFTHKGVQFTKISIEHIDPETTLMLLTDYNAYLKNMSKTNRLPPKPQPVKLVVEPDIKTTKPIDFSNEDELTKEEK